MAVDKTKHIHGYYVSVDAVLHCMCGNSILIPKDVNSKRNVWFECENCGQKWVSSFTINKVVSDDQEGYL